MSEDWIPAFRKALREDFRRIKEKNPRSSQRGYAKKLGLSSGALSDLLNEKNTWKVSPARAEEILAMISSENPAKVKALALMGRPLRDVARKIDHLDYKFITEWQYYAALLSFDIPHGAARKRAQKAIGLSPLKFREMVAEFKARDLLVENAEGVLSRKHQSITTSDEIPSSDIVTHHQDSLAQASRLLKSIPVGERDFTTNTFAVSLKKLARIKEEIRLFHNRVVAIVDDDDASEAVYRLAIQLFPLREPSSKEGGSE